MCSTPVAAWSSSTSASPSGARSSRTGSTSRTPTATLAPLPAEPAALQGWDPTLAVVDELHVVGEATWEAMALASGKRHQSLTLAISTPAADIESVMWKLVAYGREHPDDESFRLVEYAAPDDCAVDDEDAWTIANPALDDFLHRDALRSTLTTTREASFRRYRLGQWVGQVDRWLPWGAWEQLAEPDRRRWKKKRCGSRSTAPPPATRPPSSAAPRTATCSSKGSGRTPATPMARPARGGRPRRRRRVRQVPGRRAGL